MKTTHITPAIWEAAFGFPSRLAQACRGEYRAKGSFFAEPDGTPIGQADGVAISLRGLTGDLCSEHNELAAEIKKKGVETPRGRAETRKHEHALEDLAIRQKLLAEQSGLTKRLLLAYLEATCVAFADRHPRSATITAKGVVVMNPKDESGETFALTQDHPVRQAGRHIVRILAGDDRPEETGIVGELRAMRCGMTPEDAAEKSAELAELEPLAVIEDPVLRRLASLADSLIDRDLGIPRTMREIAARLMGAMELVKRASSLALGIFWHLTKSQDEALHEGGSSLALRDDWAIVSENDSAMEEMARGLMALIAGDPRLTRAVAEHIDGCGDPDCPIHSKVNRRRSAHVS